ncbi:VWFA domain-containing protein OS=Streptomyces griseomycini OX=66895 GN=FHS37_005468 PE=4 SV=1 [Streptomyces griseomycini]
MEDRTPARARSPAPAAAVREARRPPSPAGSGDRTPPVPALAAATEVLRHRDVAGLSPAEREQVRRSARRRAARRGEVGPRRTVRKLLRRGGEPARLRHRVRAERPRRVVLLVDVSGSTAPYADALLRFAHAAARGPRTEVFAVGTRLTLGELSHRNPERATAAVAAAGARLAR